MDPITMALIGAGISMATTGAQKAMLGDKKAEADKQGGAPGGPGMAILAQGAAENSSELASLQEMLELDAEEAKIQSLDVPEELA